MQRVLGLVVVMMVLVGFGARVAMGDYLTVTFGNTDVCERKGTLQVDGKTLRFDLSSIPARARVYRAILKAPAPQRHEGVAVRIVPAGVARPTPLAYVAPHYRSVDATEAARAWVANPASNKGLVIEQDGGVDFPQAVLEVSYAGQTNTPLPTVTGIKTLHQSGQTFITWDEIDDILGQDAPTFAEFEAIVLAAKNQRLLTYRIYRHSQPFTLENLGEAELVHEVPEVLSAWNLLAVHTTEHPNEHTPTKRSPLRHGNLALNHVMSRWRIIPGGTAMPRRTGLAVVTADTPGKRYYAVTAASQGREAVAAVQQGANASDVVDETPAPFPAILAQRTTTPAPGKSPGGPDVVVFVAWMDPPYASVQRPVEIFHTQWKNLPSGSAQNRLPLYFILGNYGSSASQLGQPQWNTARRYVGGAFTLGLADDGTLYTGHHEANGTWKGYSDGIVWNYEQRRVLAVTAWALAQGAFFLDPERLSAWGQAAAWMLRHGDRYAAILSDGHNNYKTSREGKKHYRRWGPEGRGTNWLGLEHLDYLDLATWVRDNPTVELPYWVGFPSYGTFPAHTLGDFGFKPWQDFVTAMEATRRAFAVIWNANGPVGPIGKVLTEVVPSIRLHQSLPAFTKVSLNARILTDTPQGEWTIRNGKGEPHDMDFFAHADKTGGINLYQRWETSTIVDQPGRWEMTLWLTKECPDPVATMDITPRRTQQFRVKPGETVQWTLASPAGQTLNAGKITVDSWGLVTAPQVELTKDKRRLVLERQ